MNDIENRSHIVAILSAFYEKAFNDDLIGPFFTTVAQIDLKEHLPVISDFWESILFGSIRYQGNVMQKHKALNSQKEMMKADFDRWMELFIETVNEKNAGPKADEMKSRAHIIAQTMFFKLDGSNRPDQA